MTRITVRRAVPWGLRAIIVAVVAAPAATALAAASGSAAASAPPCTPKITKVDGHKAAVNCGPATMSVRLHGHTYTFHNGYCSVSGGTFELSLGTTVLGVRGNAGKPSASITLISSKTGSLFGPDYGGKQLLSDTLIDPSNSGKSTGSFKSAFAGLSLSGSWNCHGVIVKS